jgi:FKBP-type peptidyl-prolyl cis-trans isomerase
MAAAPDGSMMPVLQTFTRPDGLVIEDLKFGEGKEVSPNATVVIFYRGTRADGKVVDATRGSTPAKYPLTRLIAGWQQGVPGMKVGGIRRLTVPPHMAYAAQGVPAAGIPSNATLTYSIQLVDVQAPVQANVER